MDKKMRIAYIGFGKSTNRYHLPYVKLRENIEVVRIVTPTLNKRPEEQAAWTARGTIFSTNIQDIIDDSTIDAVVVVTPAKSHFSVAKELLLAGKNVLVDKPIATSPSELAELIDIAKRNHVLVMPFQNRRFDSDFQALKRVLSADYLGELIDLEVHMDHYRPSAEVQNGDQIDGTFYGHGVHLVDQIVSLFGRPDKVGYDLRKIGNCDSEIEDHFEVDLYYGDFKAKVQSSEMAAISYPKWLVYGKQGRYIKFDIDQQEYDLKANIMPDDPFFGKEVSQNYGQVHYVNQNGDWLDRYIESPRGDYGMVYDSLYETIINGAEPLVSYEQMMTVIEILSYAFKSTVNPSIYKL